MSKALIVILCVIALGYTLRVGHLQTADDQTPSFDGMPQE